ncbi:hypothetical protein Tco_0595934 [Tanacetum coccineum]
MPYQGLVLVAFDKRQMGDDTIISLERNLNVTHELIDEIGELGAISGHMLGAAEFQIPEDNLDDLHSSREEDGTLETMDPRD